MSRTLRQVFNGEGQAEQDARVKQLLEEDMTYSESVIELKTLTIKQVAKLLRSHYVEMEDFIDSFPQAKTYDAAAVMGWLGY